MIPVSTHYDEYIDWPKLKLSDKKNPFEYIVPPPSRGVGTKSNHCSLICAVLFNKIYLFRYIVEASYFVKDTTYQLNYTKIRLISISFQINIKFFINSETIYKKLKQSTSSKVLSHIASQSRLRNSQLPILVCRC